MSGPGASGVMPRLAATVARDLDVLTAIARADLLDRYGRGGVRFAKWLLDPFALAGVYLVLIAVVLDRGGPSPGLSVACAVVPFQLLMSTVINALQAPLTRRSIVLNMGFRRILLPASSTLTETIAFAASLLLLALMMAVYGIAPTAAALWLVPTLAATVLFALACAYPAYLFGLWFRDLRPLAVSFVRTSYFLAPGLVALSEIEGDAQDLVKLNPVTGLFEAFRDALLYGQAPAAWELLYPIGFAAGLLAVFVPLYRREQRDLAKLI
jgi:lipopolysaccharide transport system permease protein